MYRNFSTYQTQAKGLLPRHNMFSKQNQQKFQVSLIQSYSRSLYSTAWPIDYYLCSGKQKRESFSLSAKQSYQTGAQSRASPNTNQELTEKLEQLRGLAGEGLRVGIETGPQNFSRLLSWTRALTSLTTQYLQSQQLDPPQKILKNLFYKLGATYIKLGQFIASSPSLFPREYVEEFQGCLDQTDSVPFEQIQQELNQELKQPYSNIFSYIDPKPLASASVAQVHAATLRNSQADVVVKVIKPGVEDALTSDLNFLFFGSRLLEIINPELKRVSLAAIIEDLRLSIMNEVDFTKEVKNMEDFQSYLDMADLRDVATCPRVYKQFSTKRIITMERLYGAALTDLDQIRKTTVRDPEQVLINALNVWSGSVLACRTFHADVHAGNLLVLRDGRVGFIDFGIVGSISGAFWASIQGLLVGIQESDYDLVGRSMVEMGATYREVDTLKFGREIKEMLDKFNDVQSQVIVVESEQGQVFSNTIDGSEQDINKLILDLAQLTEKNGIKLPREFGILFKQILYFDRYNKVLAPRLEIYADKRVNIGTGSNQAPKK